MDDTYVQWHVISCVGCQLLTMLFLTRMACTGHVPTPQLHQNIFASKFLFFHSTHGDGRPAGWLVSRPRTPHDEEAKKIFHVEIDKSWSPTSDSLWQRTSPEGSFVGEGVCVDVAAAFAGLDE